MQEVHIVLNLQYQVLVVNQYEIVSLLLVVLTGDLRVQPEVLDVLQMLPQLRLLVREQTDLLDLVLYLHDPRVQQVIIGVLRVLDVLEDVGFLRILPANVAYFLPIALFQCRF